MASTFWASICRGEHCVDYRQHLGVLGTLISSAPWSFAAAGSRGVWGGHSGTKVIDLSNPSSPTVGAFNGLIWNNSDIVMVSDTDVYTLTPQGDLSHCTLPTLSIVSSCPLPRADRLAISDSHAFAVGPNGAEPGGFFVIDLASMSVVGSLPPVGTGNNSISVVGNHACVTSAAGLHVIDISQVTAPSEVGMLALPNCTGVGTMPGFAYVVSGVNLLVCDISNPALPAILGATEISPGSSVGYGSTRVLVSGSSVFVPSHDGYQIVDVSNPGTPEVIGIAAGGGLDLGLFGNLVACAGANGLAITDGTTRTAPALATLAVPGIVNRVEASGTVAYVAGDLGLHVVDLGVPTSPVLRSTLATSSPVLDVAIDGELGCITTSAAGIQVLDLSDRDNPIPISSIAIPGVDIALARPFAYVATTTTFRVIDLTDPYAPVPRGSLNWSSAKQLRVAGSRVYATGLLMTQFDVSNPDAPSGTILPIAVADFGLQDAKLVGVNSDEALWVYDVSGPGTPVLQAGGSSLPYMPNFYGSSIVSADLANQIAYVPFTRGVLAVDVSNPAVPRPLGTSFGPEYPQDVTVADGYVLVAGLEDGLWILPSHCAATDVVGPGRSSFAFLPPEPNPAPGRTLFRIASPHAGTVMLRIFDVAGHRVRTLVGGPQAISWDGRDEAGAPVASGVYVVRATGSAGTATQRVTLLR